MSMKTKTKKAKDGGKSHIRQLKLKLK